MRSKKLISLQISLGSYASFVDRLMAFVAARESCYVCVANVHMLIEAYHSSAFADKVNQAALVTPDGKPLTWALKILFGIDQERVAGMDLLPDLLVVAEAKKIPIAFYGGTEELLRKTDEKLGLKFPKLSIVKMYSPPFRALTPEEENAVIQMMNDSGAAIIFVALGCPKQEKWMASMHGKIHAVMIGVGGALPVLAGLQKRAPSWMQHAGFEWLYRLGQEPRRLLKRYVTTNSLFIYLVLREKFRSKK